MGFDQDGQGDVTPAGAPRHPLLDRLQAALKSAAARYRGGDRRVQLAIPALALVAVLVVTTAAIAIAPHSSGGPAPLAATTAEPSSGGIFGSSLTSGPTTMPPSSIESPSGSPWVMDPKARHHRIAVGDSQVCVVLTAGTLKCWGAGNYGQLGDGTTTDSSTPVAVSGVTGAVSVVANGESTCALIDDGSVMCWGDPSYDPANVNRIPSHLPGVSGVSAIFPEQDGTCAFIGGGRLGWCGSGPDAPFDMSIATGLAAAPGVTCVLIGGAMKCWGQYGDGDFTATIGGISHATDITAGLTDACAIVAGGAVACWNYDELAETTKPKAYVVHGISAAAAIAEGEGFGCAIVAHGAVKCWGDNEFGQLGDGTRLSKSKVSVVKGITGATDIAAGGGTTCVVLAGDDVRCWGDNSVGQMGNGSDLSCALPVSVVGLGKTSTTCAAPFDPDATETPSPSPTANPTPTPTSPAPSSSPSAAATGSAGPGDSGAST